MFINILYLSLYMSKYYMYYKRDIGQNKHKTFMSIAKYRHELDFD